MLDRDGHDRLASLLEELHRSRSPRLHGTVDAADADVDLFEEEAYLVGLADRLLATGQLGATSLEIDASIDRRLAVAKPTNPRARRLLKDMLSYRARVLDLATALAQAAGVPLARKESRP